MKKYKSHKIVNAGLIIGIDSIHPSDNEVIVHVQGVNKPFEFGREIFARGMPVKNDAYLVLYNKGTDKEYYAWCPKDIFEDGNHPVDEAEPVVHLELNNRYVLQQIREDSKAHYLSVPSHEWCNAWKKLSAAADVLDAMMARDEVESD